LRFGNQFRSAEFFFNDPAQTASKFVHKQFTYFADPRQVEIIELQVASTTFGLMAIPVWASPDL